MNINRRRQNSIMVAVLTAVSVAFGGDLKKDSLPAKSTPYLDGYVENIRVDTNSMAIIYAVYACTVFVDVKKKMPEIVGRLERMAQGKDVEGLMQAYKAIGYHIYDIDGETRDRNHMYCGDAATMLAMQLDSSSSKKERLAWVFLALPRLFDRSHSSSFPVHEMFEWINDYTQMRIDAEAHFLESTAHHLPGIEAALKKYWYLADHLPPSNEQMRAFFTCFCAAF